MSKPKTCPECLAPFVAQRIGQKTCTTPKCAIAWASKNPDKGLRTNRLVECLNKRARVRQKRKDRERLMSRADWIKRAQIAFNAYIRARDAGQPCISCQTSSGCKINAGHFRSTAAAPELRFCEDNCHLQCEKCNTYLSGNIGPYRIHLIRKIGIDRVEWLEGPHKPEKWTIPQIQETEQYYKAKLREMTA